VTVYRHFPDEPALARACSGLYLGRNPPPDPRPWRAIADPHERLRTALRQSYAYHRATEAMFTHVLADARDHQVLEPYHAQGAPRPRSSPPRGAPAAAAARCCRPASRWR
jgi:hypothetical protein